jgi:Bacterial membrane protein YfhO
LAKRRGDVIAMALLAVLPPLAHAPAWWEGRLLGPGDGIAFHYPLKALVWEAYRRGELPSWNPTIFFGAPLLAAYRPGALHPFVIAASLLPPFLAFQLLVLTSLSLAAVLTFLYVRQLGSGILGAYAGGLFFSLGPYLVAHVGDTATMLGAPMLLLALIAAESFVAAGTGARAAGVAVSLGLLLLAGSPQAAGAGSVLVAMRLTVARAFGPRPDAPSLGRSAVALVAGLLLAAPQLLPALIAAREAGRSLTGVTTTARLPGLTGLVLTYVSHTPAPSLALAALPLALTSAPVRAFGVIMAVSLGLQWGRGPLGKATVLGLAFDLTLAVLAGLSLSAQWNDRHLSSGRRLRTYFLFASLASAAALSISAAALGPLPQALAGAVGVLALALILYFSLADSDDFVKASVFLLPLTVSFLLQPQGRQAWQGAPTRADLEDGTATRRAVEAAMGPSRGERTLTLTRVWPRGEEADLAYGNLAALVERRSANGYDPMVPLRSRALFDGMGPAGNLPGSFLRTDPDRLPALGIRFVQLPASALRAGTDRFSFGEAIDVTVEADRPRYFPLDLTPATEVRIASALSEGVDIPQGETVARIFVHLASGRELPLPVRAGLETAEWAWDRPALRGLVAHHRAPILESWSAGGYEGHRYLAVLGLPGRFYVDGVRVERPRGPAYWTISRMSLVDSRGRVSPVSPASAYVSDLSRFRELASGPRVRLFEVRGTVGRARVVERLKALPDDSAVLQALAAPVAAGFEARREALSVSGETGGIALDAPARSSRAEIVRADFGTIELRAQGPGLLVIAEGWDPGWSAMVDDRPVLRFRVNHDQIGVVLAVGTHRIVMRYRPRGFDAGLAMAAVSALGLGLLGVSSRLSRPTRSGPAVRADATRG